MTFLENPHFFQQYADQRELVLRTATKAAAIALVNEDNHVLLMKRVNYGAGHGLDWVYPGGVVEKGEFFDQAVIRELKEECGIVLDSERNTLFPLANYITNPNASGMRHDLLIYVARYSMDKGQPKITSPKEMIDWGWFDPQFVINSASSGVMKILPSGIFAIQRLKEYLSNEKIRTYGEVLMGGTFDRLHEGHKQLFRRAYEVGDYVYIGLTTDEYVASSKTKQHKNLVTPYSERLYLLREYLYRAGVLNRTIILPLNDTAGPKALDSKLEAIVVSEETIEGGKFVNQLRMTNNVKPMDVIVVPLLKDEEGVISSTRLRKKETGQDYTS